MQDFMDIIRERRSVRKYEDKEVSEEAFNAILESVKWAPSWNNTQCWEIVNVKDKAIQKKLQATLPLKGNPAVKAIVDAPTLLAVCGKVQSSGYYKGQASSILGDWFMFDLGIACQNVCLTAQNLGLGTVIVGLFDHEKAKDVLQVPDGYELTVMIPIGYPIKQSSAPKRREIEEFMHTDTF